MLEQEEERKRESLEKKPAGGGGAVRHSTLDTDVGALSLAFSGKGEHSTHSSNTIQAGNSGKHKKCQHYDPAKRHAKP